VIKLDIREMVSSMKVRQRNSKTILENKILQLELQVKEKELQLKQIEIESLKNKRKTFWQNMNPALLIGIIAAFITVSGNLVVTSIQGRNSLELESQKSQTSLILQAIKTGDRQKALENLKFFIDAGFIQDENNKITSLLKSGGIIPVLPSDVEIMACDLSYPTICIPPPPPDLDCADIPYRKFPVLPPDPHQFDTDHDGIGCES
jgi:hypothetical protein